MQIRVTPPPVVDDLVRFLGRMGFAAGESGYDTVRVERGARDRLAFRAQLELYVRVWQATHPGVSASLQPDDAPQG